MAKECINCGKKISMFDDSFALPYEKVWFCKDCMAEAKGLLHDIKIVISDERYKEVVSEFKKNLSESQYPQEVKAHINAEFQHVSWDFTSHRPMMMKVFKGGFQESCDAILKTGNLVSGGDNVYNSGVIDAGNAKIANFVFECYFMRTSSYASLSVNLVNYNNISTVTTVGSGGESGIFNISYGAENDFVSDFWQEFRKEFPQFELCDIEAEDDELLQLEAGKDRIGVLGGTFDPIHKGHVALGEAAIQQGKLKKLIVMPANVQPFKIGKEAADDEHRIAMAKAAFEDNDRVEVSDYEINNTVISYTYDTLAYLKKIYPQDELFFIMGTDSFLELEFWYKGLKLLENFSFMVSKRPGYKQEELEAKILRYRESYKADVIVLESRMPDISSTLIRENCKKGLSISEFVPEKVERYINDNGLYL